jgi:[ribosomal protein S5]-alanine N-acetyltransferase
VKSDNSQAKARASAGSGDSGRQTRIETTRLVLRPLQVDDAPAVARLAGRREIADTTISIPHPLSEAQARTWIATHAAPGNAKELAFAITLKADG